MKKMKTWLLSQHFAYVLISAFTARLIIFGAQFGDALVMLAFVGLHAYNKWIEAQQFKSLESETKRKLEEMQNSIASMKMNNLNKSVRLDEQKTGRYF